MRTEELAAWYFRLNGFFTITNFILHPSRRGPQRTDADIVGVRFPYRSEFPDAPGGDDPEFCSRGDKPYLLIAEVKRGLCLLNGPWTDRTKENINAVLTDLGLFREAAVAIAAESLYDQGFFDCPQYYCSLFCVGDRRNPEITSRYPAVPQRTWEQILYFFFQRFQTYENRKTDHDSWDQVGKKLWNCWTRSKKEPEQFTNGVKEQFGLSTT